MEGQWQWDVLSVIAALFMSGKASTPKQPPECPAASYAG